MEEKRASCGTAVLLCIALDTWIVMAFVSIRTWLVSLIATVIMAIFDWACVREYSKVITGPNYIIGFGVSCMVGFGMALPVWQVIVCAMFMTLLYVTVVSMYDQTKE